MTAFYNEIDPVAAQWLRNLIAAGHIAPGVPVRYGLANESSAENRHVKSADLIGIRPVLVTPEMVGTTIGQFVSREIKHRHWRWRGDEHELAQARWAMLVILAGGDASFATGPGTI